MKIAVFAYHDIGYECLKTLIEWNEEVVGVVTHEDNPDEEIWFRSVAELARSHGLPVFTPVNPNTSNFVNRIGGMEPDLILSFYYRRLLSKELLAIPRLGGINLHGSLLPRYRGRCPVNWVLINGESGTGVTLHYMVAKADAGDIIAQKQVSIDIEDTALSLFHKLTAAAIQLLRETYPLIKAGSAQRIPQDSRQATSFGGRRPEDGKISWESSSLAIHNLIRAVTHPYPGAFTFHTRRKLYLWRSNFNHQPSVENGRPPGFIESLDKDNGMIVSTGNGSLLVTRVQFEGEEEVAANELVERQRISLGMKLGE
ncbi:MAG: formyltransferase [Deltaproteobacteria bacterium]|nr:formyltransferase [Deltaproteobacteria bacterium]MCZ6907785.1 formyltransferase [Deltaproteobacteria bacterium]